MKNTEEKMQQLQMIEQNMQQTLSQKQQFQMQLMEIDSALKEIKDTEKAYKIVGNLMVSSSKEDLEKDLTSKKEMTEIRVKTFEKQENSLKEKAEGLRKEVMTEMEKKEKK